MINEINKVFDDGTWWSHVPNQETRTIDLKPIKNEVSGMVRLVPSTQKYQFEPEIMQLFWENRGRTGLSQLF